MKKHLFLALMMLLANIVCFQALTFAKGRAIIRTTSAITVTNPVSPITTNKAWFNAISQDFKISKITRYFSQNPGQSNKYRYFVEFDTTESVNAIVTEFGKSTEMVYAEPDFIYTMDAINTNDTYANEVWNMSKTGFNELLVNLPPAQNPTCYGSPSKIIAILDSGVDLGTVYYGNFLYPNTPHPDLVNNIWHQTIDGQEYYGFNVIKALLNVGNESIMLPQDHMGHGTHCAGIAAGMINNSTGVAGIAGGYAPNNGCKIMSIKVFHEGGADSETFTSLVLHGIEFADLYGANVISMSFGSGSYSQAFQDIITSINEDTVTPAPVFIASAGNNGNSLDSSPKYPACFLGVYPIASSNSNDQIASYSNTGSQVSITAPGGDTNAKILSTTPQDILFSMYPGVSNNYGRMMGTSMSAPLVAGAVGVMKSRYPTWTNDQIMQRLIGTCDDISRTALTSNNYGAGRLNLAKALNQSIITQPALRINSVVVDDILGNGTGYVECEEHEVMVSIDLKNWWINTNNTVTGTLTCTNPYVLIDTNSITWPSIGQYSTQLSNSAFSINFNVTTPCEVTFDLALAVPGYPTTTTTFTIPVYPAAAVPVFSTNSLPSSKITVGDVDLNGIDDMAFASNALSDFSSIYLYKNNTLLQIQTGQENQITCKPVFANITGDSKLEIIAFVNNVGLYIWDYNGNLLTTQANALTVHSISVEDVNNDGRLEIIGCGKPSLTASTTLFMYALTPSNTYAYFNLSIPSQVPFSLLSVGKVDTDDKKKGVLMTQNETTDYLYLNKIDYTYNYSNQTGQITNTATSIAPPTSITINDKKITNIVLLKPNLQGEVLGYNRIYVGFGFSGSHIIQPDNDPTTIYHDYCYDYSTTTAQEIWSYGESEIIFGGSMPTPYLLAANCDDNPGVEIMSTVYERIMDEENGDFIRYMTDNHDPMWGVHLFLGFVPKSIGAIGTDTQQYFITVRNSGVYFYNQTQNEQMPMRLNIWETIQDVALGTLGTNTRNLFIVDAAGNGYVYTLSKSNTDEWTQSQNNNRATGSYYQAIPATIPTIFDLSYDAIMTSNITIPATSRINIKPGVEIRVAGNYGINVAGIINAPGTSSNRIKFTGMCPTTTKSFWTGINVASGAKATVSYTDINNADIGMYIASREPNTISYNLLTNNRIGISLYNTDVRIFANKMLNNTYGSACYNNTTTAFGLTSGNGTNTMSSNTSGLYISSSSPGLDYYHNNFADNSTYNVQIGLGGRVPYINCRNNWWGTNDEIGLRAKFSNVTLMRYDPWDSAINTLPFAKNMTVFQQACQALEQKQYAEAIPLFKSCVEDTIEIEQVISASALLNCYKNTDNLEEMGTYLEARLAVDTNPIVQNALLNTKARMHRYTGNYSSAINYYESILMNNPTYEDSCYAVIDIGDTYLESAGKAKGMLSNLNPPSMEQHSENTQALLKSIMTGEHLGVVPPAAIMTLNQNYPNPFNPETTLSFSIPAEGKVELSIYNIKGQKVKTLLNETMPMGGHKVVWNGKNSSNKKVASGVYFSKLTSGGKTQIKKMLLMK